MLIVPVVSRHGEEVFLASSTGFFELDHEYDLDVALLGLAWHLSPSERLYVLEVKVQGVLRVDVAGTADAK